MQKADIFPTLIALLGLGMGLYLSTFQIDIIRSIGITMIAISILGLCCWVVWNRRSVRNKREQIVQLSDFYSTSEPLLRLLTVYTVQDDDYKKLQADIDQWSLNLERYIDQKLGVAVKSRLLEIPFPIPHGGSDDVVTIWALPCRAETSQRFLVPSACPSLRLVAAAFGLRGGAGSA